jgi:xylulokinase
MAYAGLDIGTSGCKIIVYDLNGAILFKAARRYRERGGGGHRELDAKMVSNHVLDMLAETGQDCHESIEAMAVASLGESVVCLDSDESVLAPSMLMGDSRGIEEALWLSRKIGQGKIMETTGLPPNELYSLSKFIWLKNNTDVIDHSQKILFFEDYIGYLLTGQRAVSYSSACRSMAFDIHKKVWSKELLALAGIRPEQMSKPVEAGTIIGTILLEMAEKLHLNPAMTLVAGGHDRSCAALGGGMYDMKTCETSMGTCEFMLFMLPYAQMSPYMVENNFTCIPYILKEKYLSSLEVTTCGILQTWGKETLFSQAYKDCEDRGVNFFAGLEPKIAGLHTDVLALPQFGSSGNPNLSMDARSTICGLTIHTKPEEIFLALLEGITFQLYLAYERLQQLDVKPEYMAATGGLAVSDVVLQIRADMFNMEVIRPTSDESGTLGCMLLAATGIGAYPSIEEGIRRAVSIQKTFSPDPVSHSYYIKKYQKYKALYERMYDFK